MPSDFWDLRRLQPMTMPGTVPSVTTVVPPSPPVTAAPAPVLAPTPPPRLPSLTMFPGLPMGPHTGRETITTPPMVPAVGPGSAPTPLVGPGAATPAITGAPTRPVMPGTEFGNPATREAIRTTPNTPAKGPYDDIYEKAARGDFNGAIAGLSKAMGGGGGGVAAPAAHPMQVSHGNPGFHQVNTQGDMDKIIANLTSRLAHDAWEKKSAKRRREQNRYDILERGPG